MSSCHPGNSNEYHESQVLTLGTAKVLASQGFVMGRLKARFLVMGNLFNYLLIALIENRLKIIRQGTYEYPAIMIN